LDSEARILGLGLLIEPINTDLAGLTLFSTDARNNSCSLVGRQFIPLAQLDGLLNQPMVFLC
jgi:hypothetical protein